MTDILIYGDTVRSPELRHEVPLTVPDPFLYAERDGSRYVYVGSLEVARIRELDGIETHPYEEVGYDELIALRHPPRGHLQAARPQRLPRARDHERRRAAHLPARAGRPSARRGHRARRRSARLFARGAGVSSRASSSTGSAARSAPARRRWTPCASCCAAATQNGAGLEVDGQPLTSERLKRRIGEVFNEHDMLADEFIVSHGAQSAVGHDMGSGQIRSGEPIVVDLWPRDRETACFADMTRTYVVGEPPAELVDYQRLSGRRSTTRSARSRRACPAATSSSGRASSSRSTATRRG